MGKSLERHKLPKLKQEDTDNLNKSISLKGIKALLRNTPTKKTSDGFTQELHKIFKKKVIPILQKLFQKIKRREHFLTHSTSPL